MYVNYINYIMLHPMPYYKRHYYNNNNFHQFAPFRFHNVGDVTQLVLDTDFYRKIKGTIVETQIKNKFKDFKTEDNVLYDQNPEDLPEGPERTMFFDIYRYQMEWYNADRWCHVLAKPYAIVSYNEFQKNKLKEISHRMISGGTQELNENDTEDLQELIMKLNEGVQKCRTETNGCFVKMSGGSTKHDYPIEEVFSGKSILNHLLPSQRVHRNLDNGSILVQLWNDNMSMSKEFRVFIEKNKVIGITQQSIYNIYQECISIYGKCVNEMVDKAQHLWNSIKTKLEYEEATLDVWMNNDNEMELVEINTYGKWTGAGSGWFDWKNDFPKADNIKNIEDVEVRITYPDKYFGVSVSR
jgi:hypothetical protein